MIKIDFATAIAVFLFVTLLLVIGGWIFYTYTRKENVVEESEHLETCPYCTHLFFNYLNKAMVVCPKCKSYITLEEKKDTKI